MIGGKLKLKNNKGLEKALKFKRKAEMTSEELKEQLEKEQKKLEEQKRKEQSALNYRDEYIEQPVQKGAGKLITSGKAVHGTDTSFQQDLDIGDFIIIEHPQTQAQERRKVNMVLSNRSCGIEEPFSEDLINKCDYLFQKKPKLRERERDVDDIIQERLKKEKEKLLEGNGAVYGTSSGAATDKWGENAGPKWTGKVEEEQERGVSGGTKKGFDMFKKRDQKGKGKELTKEEQLDKRVKQKTDKFCWF
eukprot:403335669